MNKSLLAVTLLASVVLVTGCVTESVYYTPAYSTSVYTTYRVPSNRYVYTVSYGSPYWNDAYYYGYDDLGDVGYWGMYDSYNVY